MITIIYKITLPAIMNLENTSLGLKAKMGYSLVSILVLTFITQFAADGYVGIDDFFTFILIIYTISIIPIVIIHHFVKIYLRNTNDSEIIQTRAEIEFASKNYTKALSLYKKLGDLEKISLCIEQLEKVEVPVARNEIVENEPPQDAGLQLQDTVVTGDINYIVNSTPNEVVTQPQNENDEQKKPNFLKIYIPAAIIASVISAAFKEWLMG